MMAIVETALSADPQRMIALCHGGGHKEDLYADSFLRDLANKFSAFSYYPVLSDEKHDQTLSGLVGDIALGHCCDLDTIRIYAAGSKCCVASTPLRRSAVFRQNASFGLAGI